MELKAAVRLAGALTILVFCGVPELLVYRQASEFFAQHQIHIQQGAGSNTLLASLNQGKQSLLLDLAALRILSMIGAIAAFSVVLNPLWTRYLTRPVRLLRDRINAMSRGGWTHPIPAEDDRELGSLVRDFNLLGPKLTFAAHQFAAASKLAAMALIGQRVTRQTTAARSQLAEIQQSLSEARLHGGPVPLLALRQIAAVTQDLATLAEDLESGFNEEVIRQGLPPVADGANVSPSPAGPTNDASPASDGLKPAGAYGRGESICSFRRPNFSIR